MDESLSNSINDDLRIDQIDENSLILLTPPYPSPSLRAQDYITCNDFAQSTFQTPPGREVEDLGILQVPLTPFSAVQSSASSSSAHPSFCSTFSPELPLTPSEIMASNQGNASRWPSVHLERRRQRLTNDTIQPQVLDEPMGWDMNVPGTSTTWPSNLVASNNFPLYQDQGSAYGSEVHHSMEDYADWQDVAQDESANFPLPTTETLQSSAFPAVTSEEPDAQATSSYRRDLRSTGIRTTDEDLVHVKLESSPSISTGLGDEESRPRPRQSSRRSTTSKGKFRCPECSKEFTRSHNRKQHEETHNPNRPRPFPCSWNDCGLKFMRWHDLNRHEHTVHLKKNGYPCEECGHPFQRLDSLRRHEKTCTRLQAIREKREPSSGSRAASLAPNLTKARTVPSP